MKTAADIFSQLNGLRLSDGTSAGERLRTTVTPPSQPSSTSPAQSQGVFAFALPKGSQGNDLQQQIQQLQQQKQQQQQALVTSSSSSSPVVLSTPPTTARPTAQLSLSQMLRGTTNGNTNGATAGQSGHLPPPPYPGNASKEERTNTTTTTTIAGRELNGSSTTPVKVTGAAGAITRVGSSGGVSITIGGSAAAVPGTSSPVVVVPASYNSSSGFTQGGTSNVVPPSSSTASSSTQVSRVAAQVTSTLPMFSATTSNVPSSTSHLPPTAPLPNVRSAALRANETLYSPCLVPQLHTPSLRSSSGVNSPTSLNDVMGPPAATSSNTNHQHNNNNTTTTTNNSNTAAQRSNSITTTTTTTTTSGVTTWNTSAGASAQANAQRGCRQASSGVTTTTTSAPPVTAAITSTNSGVTMSRATLRSPVVEQLKAVAPSAAFTTSPVKSSTLQPYSPITTAIPASNNNTSNNAGPTIIAGTGEALNPKVLEFFHNARSLTSSGTGSTGLNGANVVSGEATRSAKGQEGTRQSKTMVSRQETSDVSGKATQGTKSATTADNTHSTTSTSKMTLPVPRHEQATRQAAATQQNTSSETVNEAELRAKIASAVSSGNVNRAAAHGTMSSKTATKTNADTTNTSGSNGHTPGRTSVAATSAVPESRRRESAEAKNNTNVHEMTMQEATAVNAFLPAAFGDKELLDNTTVQKPLIRQLPSIPADGRYIIVGDVHGCVEQLEALVAKVKYVPGHDCLVVIGDFVNKGPDSVGVIRLCQRLKVLGVLGNHDYTLLKCCARHRRRAYCPDDLRDPVKRLAKDFPLDCELYLRGLPHMLRLPKYNLLLVHAGLNLEHTIEEQSMIEIMHLRRLEKVTGNKNNTTSGNNDKSGKCEHSPRERAATTNAPASPASSDETHKEHYVAITKGQAGTPWAELWSGPEHVIFGHDAYAGFQAHRFAYGIDTGCVYGDPLTCVVFSATSPQGEFYSVPGLPRHANELMGLPPPNSDIYEQLQPDLERHIIRPTTRSTPMQLMPGSPALFASTPADFAGSFQLGPATSAVQNNNSSAFPAQVTLCGVNVSTADAMSNGSPNASLTKPLSSPILHSARTNNNSNAHHELALTNTSASLHMLQTALNEAASVATYEVQKATLLALATAHELRALGVVLAMPVYEKDVDAMMNADATNETAQQAFWSPFARGILEAAVNSRHEGPDEVEDMVRLVLSVCEMMARVRREVTPMLKAMLDTSEATQGWSRSIQKHISIVLQD